jgi:hypothetical protein
VSTWPLWTLKRLANTAVDRYWGDSSPYSYLDTEALQYLTLDQSISDLIHFSKTIDLPFDTNSSSNSQNAVSDPQLLDVMALTISKPWVLSGGSYSGALAAWTASTQPGTFWAYHSSSAPVEAVDDYVSSLTQGRFFTNTSSVAILLPHPARNGSEL